MPITAMQVSASSTAYLFLACAALGAQYAAGDRPLPLKRLLDIAVAYEHEGHVTYPRKGEKCSDEERRLDCVGFLQTILQRTKEVQGLSRGERTQLLRDVAIIVPDSKALADLIQAEDPLIQGVVTGLTRVRLGLKVDPRSKLLSGDVLQYWRKNSDGSWMGHTAIIRKVHSQEGGKLESTLFGSHRSRNGVADLRITLDLTRDRVFVVRPRGLGGD